MTRHARPPVHRRGRRSAGHGGPARLGRLAVLAVARCVVPSCGHPTAASAPITTRPCAGSPAPARARHVIWIWMENHRRGQVIGSRAAPFVTSLARLCGEATDFRTVGDPSLPNYLGATSGSVHGVIDNEPPSAHPLAVDNLFRQVRAAGGTAMTYAERLPTFALVIPDLCHDTHDCPVSVGDAWLHDWVGRLVTDPAYAAGGTVVFVVWDEPTPMPFVVVAPSVRPGTVVSTPANHFALLRSTEDLLGVPHLGAAATAPKLRTGFGI